jgi:hypothetical protein
MLGRSLACALTLWLSLQGGSPARSLVEVWYAGPGASAPVTALSDMDAIRRDFGLIRRSGYNAISTWVAWAEAEPKRGAIALAGTEGLVAAAAAEGLQVSVHVLVDSPPPWAGSDPSARLRFVEAIRARLTGAPGVRRIEVGRPDDGEALITVAPDGSDAARARLAFWSAIARGADMVLFRGASGGTSGALLALGETAGVVTRNQALFASLEPRSRGVREVSGGSGPSVEVRLLQAADVVMVIGLNRAPAPRTVRIAFEPDIPEAIWQNLETGAAVNFVMTKTGPVLEHTFAAHDALVLMTRTKLR